MSTNANRVIVRHAARGTKVGWITVSGELPPDVAERWRLLMDDRGAYQSDLIHEAVILLLKHEDRKGRKERRAENGSGRRDSDLTPAGSAA